MSVSDGLSPSRGIGSVTCGMSTSPWSAIISSISSSGANTSMSGSRYVTALMSSRASSVRSSQGLTAVDSSSTS
jgi:hypothetical protein